MNIVQLNTVNLGGDIIIKKCEGGSESGGGGGSKFEYLDLSGLSAEQRGRIGMYAAMLARGIFDDGTGNKSLTVGSIAVFATGLGYADWGEMISAIATDFSAEVILGGQKMTVSEVFPLIGEDIDLASIPRISKEEFYALTTE